MNQRRSLVLTLRWCLSSTFLLSTVHSFVSRWWRVPVVRSLMTCYLPDSNLQFLLRRHLDAAVTEGAI